MVNFSEVHLKFQIDSILNLKSSKIFKKLYKHISLNILLSTRQIEFESSFLY